jgi:ketosteroid isomerase-like protein
VSAVFRAGACRVVCVSSPSTSKTLIERFYSAFAECEGERMAACYAPDATFSDPVFGKLDGREAGGMWRMLTGQAADLRIELLDSEVEGDRGSAHWRAHYTFSQTGNSVVNDVHASFRFSDGGGDDDGGRLIAEHVDDFDFYRWARQALGTRGLLLGWTPFVRSAVRGRAKASLEQFLAQESSQKG